jgi:hypothetical protein
MKKILFCLFLWCLAGICAAQEDTQEIDTSGEDILLLVPDASFMSNIFYKGDVRIKLDKEIYYPGDTLMAEISVYNLEDFSLPDTSLVVELVRGGGDRVYPSQLSEKDNVFYETVIDIIALNALSDHTLSYNYTIPSDMRNGSYRLEVYAKTKRTPIVGIPHIFLSPRYVSFKVSGAGEFPYARIMRTLTVFENTTGPVGPPVNKSEEVTGVIYIQTDSKKGVENAILKISVCEWDDTSCSGQDLYWGEDYVLASIPPGETGKVVVIFKAPDKPNAYAIRMELQDKEGRTLSLYRNRIIVQGEAARIRKLALSGLYSGEDTERNISVLVGPSPDHYSYPAVSGAKLLVHLREGNKDVFADLRYLPVLSAGNGLVQSIFHYNVPANIGDYEVCSEIESKTGYIFDDYCFNVSASEYADVKQLTITWQYLKKDLVIELCSLEYGKITAFLSSAANKKVIGFREDLQLNPCANISFESGRSDYVLTVNDLLKGRQYSFEINTSEIEDNAPEETMEETKTVCGDSKCDGDENTINCCTDCGCGGEQDCTGNICSGRVPLPAKKDPDYKIPALMILLIFVVLAYVGIYNEKKRRKNGTK